MIETFLDNNDTSMCCGCSVCADSCPVGAISFGYGSDGAKYPKINEDACISCGACRRVCPVKEKPLLTDAAFEKRAYALMVESDDLREKSASGGAFEAIATALHEMYDDLMVVGAVWGDDLRVYHKMVPYSEREALKKSKYVQSNCEGIYKEVKQKLTEGVHVLFTGTPCQIAALRNHLKKEYDNLFLVDLVCHGTPGEHIFKKYLDEFETKIGANATKVTFRHKKKDLYGEVHSKYIRIQLDNGKVIEEEARRNPYLRGFHAGLFYRDSCYSCKYANEERYGDITVGDYWRIQELNPEYVDYSGVSCLLFNTDKGWQIFDKMKNCKTLQTDVDALYKRNGQLLHPSKANPKHDYFMSKFGTEPFELLMDDCIKSEKVYKSILSSLLPGKLKRKVKSILRKKS